MSIKKNLIALISASAAIGLARRKGGKSAYQSGSGIPKFSKEQEKEIEALIGDRWSQTQEQLREKVASWVPPLDPNKFYIISTRPIKEFYNMENVMEGPGTKPFFSPSKPNKLKGKEGSAPMWFALGDAWVNWMIMEMPHWMYGSNYLYEIELNWDNIGIVNQDFKDKYVTGSGGWYSIQKIKWDAVVARYAGLYDSTGHQLELWDIPSGCVWNWDGIKSIHLVASKPDAQNQTESQEREEIIMTKGDVTFGGSFYR